VAIADDLRLMDRSIFALSPMRDVKQ